MKSLSLVFFSFVVCEHTLTHTSLVRSFARSHANERRVLTCSLFRTDGRRFVVSYCARLLPFSLVLLHSPCKRYVCLVHLIVFILIIFIWIWIALKFLNQKYFRIEKQIFSSNSIIFRNFSKLKINFFDDNEILNSILSFLMSLKMNFVRL